MIATLSSDGKVVLPLQLRETAQLEAGDNLEAHFYRGTIVLRKHRPLSSEECAVLLERSRSQPKPTPEDEAALAEAIREATKAMGSYLNS